MAEARSGAGKIIGCVVALLMLLLGGCAVVCLIGALVVVLMAAGGAFLTFSAGGEPEPPAAIEAKEAFPSEVVEENAADAAEGPAEVGAASTGEEPRVVERPASGGGAAEAGSGAAEAGVGDATDESASGEEPAATSGEDPAATSGEDPAAGTAEPPVGADTPPRAEAETVPIVVPAPKGPEVSHSGDGTVVLVSGGDRYSVPGSVPPGRYDIEVTFSDGVAVTAGTLTVREGTSPTVTCNERMGICRGG